MLETEVLRRQVDASGGSWVLTPGVGGERSCFATRGLPRNKLHINTPRAIDEPTSGTEWHLERNSGIPIKGN